ncbi:hypothetical protein, partial [Klebsiella pneumoniae]|uniref:hypothetical protein n=1 Tax=Klebsiella pneumoniae TaxID=573 RepID=UPI001CB6EACB
MKKQWDKILASARRQILAQVSAFPALMGIKKSVRHNKIKCPVGNDSNLLIVFYVQIMPDD